MMDEQTRQNYERAAVALESHLMFCEVRNANVRFLAMTAFDTVDAKQEYKGKKRTDSVINSIDRAAARLLRECLANDRPLP